MRPVLVVVLDVLAEHGFELMSSEDEHAVEALAPEGAHERSRWRSPAAPGAGLADPDALCGEDGVEGNGELGVPIADENLTALAWVASSMEMLRARWVTRSVTGLVVTPAMRTRRVSWWMKPNT